MNWRVTVRRILQHHVTETRGGAGHGREYSAMISCRNSGEVPLSESEERSERDEAGRVRRRYAVRDGVLEGLCTVWNEEGWVALKATFSGGLLDGELTQFDADGAVTAVMHYRGGKLHGESRFFDGGRLQLKTDWIDGQQDGESVVFGDNGRPTTRSRWRAGKLHGRSEWFRPDGSLLRSVDYEDGEPR